MTEVSDGDSTPIYSTGESEMSIDVDFSATALLDPEESCHYFDAW